ncbi:flavin monoamine oxidase family protein [Palleronia sp. KMU-117]|uniref:flavin monoamine oxidase family protein n=1 Tax=Palleronia sp. KMU-117 TaxID=3434108 RepID=UPI003D71A525
MKTEIAIVGGGLSGLALAARLQDADVDFHLFEARSRLGGRIAVLNTPTGSVDLGPSWFWPGQPRIASLVNDLGVRAFPQYATGDVCFEDDRGTVHRGMGFASMEGSFRLEGGMESLITGVAARLADDRVHVASRVTDIAQGGRLLTDRGQWCEAKTVVLALPPRVAAKLRFHPALDKDVVRELQHVPTWMAGHAKFVAVYDTPFWRTAGLSGDATSRRGPLAEIHDASGAEGAPAALFGFLGVPAARRRGRDDEIRAAALQQLARIFGPEAAAPVTTSFMDWACEPETATELDADPPIGHPAYGPLPPTRGLWKGRLHFASTETAPDMGGLMEGALASAERIFNLVSPRRQKEFPAS